jgi:hypothetical protein
MLGPDPILTLHVPRSAILTALAALGKQPFELVAGAHASLIGAVQAAEEMAVMEVIRKRMEEDRAREEASMPGFR